MKTRNIITSILLALTIGLVYAGCKKEDKKPSNANAATDNAVADNAFAGIWKQISIVADSSNTIRSAASTLSTYPIVTISPFNTTQWPKTVTIDFGTTNCLGSDYNNRRGIIKAVFTGPYQDSATVITITLTNYYHNDYHVEGTQTITNMGHVSNGHLVYNVIVNNAIITHPTNGTHSTWNTNQNREFFAGYDTPYNIINDVYLITGTANGVSADGGAYNLLINTALQVNVNCHWIVSGSFTLTLADYPNYPIVFDYGAGTCDATATATLNGTTYNIVMQ